MAWKGKMTCQVNNVAGRTIAVVMGHDFSSHSDSFPFRMLKNGESAEFTINVGSGANDSWWVNFMTDDGKYQYRFNKYCNVEQSDLASGKPVVVNLTDTGFDIHTPVSGPCDDNFLFGCPTTDG